MGRLGYSKSEIKTILDHSEGRQNDTTDMHYDLEQSLPEKFGILCAWARLIAGAMDNLSTHQQSAINFQGRKMHFNQ
jgi:hypothetical protein